MPKKVKGKNPDKMSHLIFLKKILTATETMTQKFPTYLLGMSNHIFKFIFKTAQYPFVASLC